MHLHSNIPFLALEGTSIEWIRALVDNHIGLIVNSEEAYSALRVMFDPDQLFFLPNVYISEPDRWRHRQDGRHLNIGCFGAVRPMKNQLLQALAAIKFSQDHEQSLRFHINASRVETGGSPVLKNLRALFKVTQNAELVEHEWMEPEDFLTLLQGIDIGMQVSLTETFNVVTADYVTAGCPIVVSDVIKWVSSSNQAESDAVPAIVHVMHEIAGSRILVKYNQFLLQQFSADAQEQWDKFVRC